MKNSVASIRFFWALLLLLLACGHVSAQQAGTRTVVRAGKLLDVKSGKIER
jgi:hypothetical protein